MIADQVDDFEQFTVKYVKEYLTSALQALARGPRWDNLVNGHGQEST